MLCVAKRRAFEILMGFMQAYDSAAEKQQWGGDRFACTVAMKDRPEVTGRVTIEDTHYGQYVCTYALPELVLLNLQDLPVSCPRVLHCVRCHRQSFAFCLLVFLHQNIRDCTVSCGF